MTGEDLSKLAAKEIESRRTIEHEIRVCVGTGCLSSRSDALQELLEAEIKQRGLDGRCVVKGVGCRGLCAAGPLVTVEPNDILYKLVQESDIPAIAASVGAAKVERLLEQTDTPFFRRQHKIVLENAGVVDPDRLEEYVAAGGYTALIKALTTMTPAEAVGEVTRSGLRGRGGAGFPAGLKWSTVAKSGKPGEKFVICNGDEGDPGAFMDRSVMEADPHRVLEGMAIAAYAVGASQGYVYVRAEYPLAVKRLRKAIRDATKAGLLGPNIAGSTFSFTVEIRLGAGAFVCGEETALIASIEGRRGQPRPRPPYPAMSGLWGKPTLINNVETLANIAPIIRRGGDWYASIGTEKSKGTKVFALTGRIVNSGLIEVPMGISLREIVFDIGGGIPGGRKFKAVQTGGPSGGCIPEQHLDMKIDYDSLASVGSMMGSGGMIIMDESSCMVDVAKFFMEFCRDESCGKCIPCRVGTAQMYDLLAKITAGVATLDDLALLEELCDVTKATSLCGLGMTAPNPVQTTLRYFRDEYIAHIVEGRCPAGVCKIRKPSAERQEVLV